MENLASLAVGQILEKGAAQVPDKIAVVDGEQRKTYGELNMMADALAARLAHMGFQQGDCVAIYMKNALELVVAFYALQKLGVIVAWVNPFYRQTEAKFILRNSGAKGVFIFAEWEDINYLGDMLDLKNDLPDLETIIFVGRGQGPDSYPFHDLIEEGRNMSSPPVNIQTNEDLSMLLYTSGTTGKPKGGMIAPEGLIARVENEMNIYLTSFWGASEVGPGLGSMCPYPSPLDIREQYIGRPVDGTRMRVVDPLTREELKEGQIGELVLKGWHLMQGYWKNPEETDRQIIDGWLHMGDLASREPDGFFKIHGRTKDLINRGGYKIYPHELECLLVEHPKVEQVCVVATSNPVLGESICACVIPGKDQTVTLSEVRDLLKDKVAPHKLPDELCIMEDFPKLSGGVKIKKFGEGGLAQLATKDPGRERIRK